MRSVDNALQILVPLKGAIGPQLGVDFFPLPDDATNQFSTVSALLNDTVQVSVCRTGR